MLLGAFFAQFDLNSVQAHTYDFPFLKTKYKHTYKIHNIH